MTNNQSVNHEISPSTLSDLQKQGEAIQLIDVRSQEKHDAYHIGGEHIPTDELPNRLGELRKDCLIVTYCTMGGRSMRALEYLLSQGFTNVKSLAGGITAWQQYIGKDK